MEKFKNLKKKLGKSDEYTAEDEAKYRREAYEKDNSKGVTVSADGKTQTKKSYEDHMKDVAESDDSRNAEHDERIKKAKKESMMKMLWNPKGK